MESCLRLSRTAGLCDGSMTRTNWHTASLVAVLVVLGALIPGSQGSHTQAEWIIEPPPGWTGRHAACAAFHKGATFIAGGAGVFADPGPSSAVWSSHDLQTWTMLAPYCRWTPRAHCALVSFKDNLLLIGGANSDLGTRQRELLLADVWESSDGVSWEAITTTAPWGKRTTKAVVWNDAVWLVGGSVNAPTGPGNHGVADVWRSNDGHAWVEVTRSAPWAPRLGYSAAVFSGRLYVAGGFNTSVGPLRTLWSSEDGKTWTPAAQPTWLPRSEFVLAELPLPVPNNATGLVTSVPHLVAAAGQDILYPTCGNLNCSCFNDVWVSSDGTTWAPGDVAGPTWSGRSRCAAAVTTGPELALLGGSQACSSGDNIHEVVVLDVAFHRPGIPHHDWYYYVVLGVVIALAGTSCLVVSGYVVRSLWRQHKTAQSSRALMDTLLEAQEPLNRPHLASEDNGGYIVHQLPDVGFSTRSLADGTDGGSYRAPSGAAILTGGVPAPGAGDPSVSSTPDAPLLGVPSRSRTRPPRLGTVGRLDSTPEHEVASGAAGTGRGATYGTVASGDFRGGSWRPGDRPVSGRTKRLAFADHRNESLRLYASLLASEEFTAAPADYEDAGIELQMSSGSEGAVNPGSGRAVAGAGGAGGVPPRTADGAAAPGPTSEYGAAPATALAPPAEYGAAPAGALDGVGVGTGECGAAPPAAVTGSEYGSAAASALAPTRYGAAAPAAITTGERPAPVVLDEFGATPVEVTDDGEGGSDEYGVVAAQGSFHDLAEAAGAGIGDGGGEAHAAGSSGRGFFDAGTKPLITPLPLQRPPELRRATSDTSTDSRDSTGHAVRFPDEAKASTPRRRMRRRNRRAGQSLSIKVLDFEELELDAKPLGSGNFGAVYQGHFRGARVAVKKLFAQEERRESDFLAEAAVFVHVSGHPHVVQFMGVCTRPSLCLVTEFAVNGSVEGLLVRSRRKVALLDIVRWGQEAASGLLHLHREGVVHRDVATRNLLLDESWHVKVCDFGLSRAVLPHEPADGVDTTRSRGGPLRWMAPESLRPRPGQPRFSPASDVYMLGIALWEMLARRLPYRGVPAHEAALRVCTEGLRPNVPAKLHLAAGPMVEVMMACWAEDPAARPSVSDVVHKLTDYHTSLQRKADTVRRRSGSAHASGSSLGHGSSSGSLGATGRPLSGSSGAGSGPASGAGGHGAGAGGGTGIGVASSGTGVGATTPTRRRKASAAALLKLATRAPQSGTSGLR